MHFPNPATWQSDLDLEWILAERLRGDQNQNYSEPPDPSAVATYASRSCLLILPRI